MSTHSLSATKARKSPWPTVWAPLPIGEAVRALEYAGTNGVAIYAALHILRFRAPPVAKSAFHASAANIAALCGISGTRLREPLRALEACGLVKIERPRGAARLAHEAFKYSLLPYFVVSNKVRFGTDKTSAQDGATRPPQDGPELGAISSASSIALPTGEDIEPPTAVPGAVAPASQGGEWY